MKKILIPTDFSDTSKCAFFYARKLGEAMGGATLKLVHVFMPAVESEYPNFVPPVSEFLKVRRDMLREFCQEVCEQAKATDNLNVEEDLLVGFPADEISRVSKEYDLIVMGTTGDSDLLNKIFGSVSSSVARRADCPVILVPKDMQFSGFNNILYTSNYESADEETVEMVMDFNRPFNACVHFVHVRENEEEADKYDRSKEEIFEELFETGDPAFSFEMAEVQSDSVAEGINKYVQDHRIDLVVVVSRQRNFWENFFHKSRTKQLALTSRIPLMVLHL